MAGNLSLYQEVQFIEKMNGWVKEGALARTKHKPVQIKWIEMLRELDVESKLDRDPAFIQGMMTYGEEQAEAFLNLRAEVSEEGQERYRRAAYG